MRTNWILGTQLIPRLFLTIFAFLSACATSDPVTSAAKDAPIYWYDGAVHWEDVNWNIDGANKAVALASVDWALANTWDEASGVWYLKSHINPYISTRLRPHYYWDYWCAGFVTQVAAAANGSADPDLVAAAPNLDIPDGEVPYNSTRDTPDKIGAKRAFAILNEHGRINTDIEKVPPGAAIFWTGGLPYGHVAIVTGLHAPDGAALIATTGWPSRPGTWLRPLPALIRELGRPAGVSSKGSKWL